MVFNISYLALVREGSPLGSLEVEVFAFKTFECWMPKLTSFIEGGGGGVLVDGEGPGQEDQYQVLGSFISNTIKQS